MACSCAEEGDDVLAKFELAFELANTILGMLPRQTPTVGGRTVPKRGARRRVGKGARSDRIRQILNVIMETGILDE